MRVGATPFSDPRQLAAIDDLLRASPDDVSLRFGRACALEDLGYIDEALKAYVDVLTRRPTHFGGLTNLGSLLFERGYLEQARPYYEAAQRLYPDDPLAQANAATLYAAGGDDEAAIAAFATALALKTDYLHAHLGLAQIYTRRGDTHAADAHFDRAFAEPRAWSFPFRGTGTPLRVLVLASAFGGDLVTNQFFDETIVQKAVLLADSVRGAIALPPCDLVFNAIGDADRCRPSLERAAAIVAAAGIPAINAPEAVLQTGRAEVMQRLQHVAGVRAPRTQRFARDDVTADALAAAGFAFPLLLRSPGYHTGEHFVRVETAAGLPAAVAALPGREVLAIAFLDARGADGGFRKYRVIAVDGVLFPVHLAVAPQWKVHYFTADMAERADHRAEEAAFLTDMPGVLGPRALAALRAVVATLGLEYCGVDFALDAAGDVLVFEANATMAVYPAGPEAMWDYRRDAAGRVIAAVRAMLLAKAGVNPDAP